jgi:hypothetical protein
VAARRWQLAIGLVAMAALLAQAFVYRRYVCDDAYITLRYAKRLLAGHGLTWTDGERVEGYSNLAWLLACAGLGRLGLDLVDATRVLGVTFMGLSLSTIVRAQRTPIASAVAAFTFALAGPIAVWTVGGLEPPMVAAFLALGTAATLRLADDDAPAPTAIGLPLAGLVLTRPDGILLAGLLALGLAWARRRLKPSFVLFTPAALAWAGQLLFRLAYYHAWVPNTAYAKLRFGEQAWRASREYLWSGTLCLSGLLPLALLGLIMARRGRAKVLLVPLVIWIAYVAAIGGDWMPAHRHLVPVIVLVAFAAAQAADGRVALGRDAKLRLALFALMSLVWFGLTQLYDPDNLFAAHGQVQARNEGERVGAMLGQAFAARRPLLAVDWAGSIPYRSELPALDMLGLCDAWIAHHPPAVGRELNSHALGDGDYVLRRAPDLVLFRGPWGGDPVFASGKAMKADPRFAEYRRITFVTDEIHSDVYVRLHGRAGIDAADPLRIPGWLFATVPGNVARLDATGQLAGELSARASVATRLSGMRIAEIDPADAAVDVDMDATGLITVRPRARAVWLRAVRVAAAAPR